MTSPTARSTMQLKKDGYIPAIVEHWNRFAGIRQDLYGFIDIVAMHPAHKGLLGIQTTSTANMSARVKKIINEPRARVWLTSGNSILVWGWSKKGERGKVKHWTLTSKQIVCLDQNSPLVVE